MIFPQGITGGGWSSLPSGDGLYFNKYNNDLSYSVSVSNFGIKRLHQNS
ncbi:hypothetical protein IWX83_003423 [Flavobacterium sp. CG_9.1]|nr:hypothetical protein [Flavobacterium sp. CG_9.1]